MQSTLKLSWNTVVVPLALIVKCNVSCTRKLFSGPWPIILKLFTNVSFAWPFWREFLKLDETIYQEILKTIHETGKVFERLPSTYAGKDEESLRDHLILQLEPRFEYSSTGETFNKSGKTDILIRHQKSNIFVAECKFWGGAKKHFETIDQILSYLTWRDSKTAWIQKKWRRLSRPSRSQRLNSRASQSSMARSTIHGSITPST